MNKFKYTHSLSYEGNIFWPIFFLIIFFPIGLLMLLLNVRFKKDGITYGVYYRGSKGWLYTWTLIFFPVAIILGAMNGFEIFGIE